MSGTPWRFIRDLIPLVGTNQVNALVIDETHMPRRMIRTKTQKRLYREWPVSDFKYIGKLNKFDGYGQQH